MSVIHPDDNQIQEYVNSSTCSAAVRRHIETCPECMQRASDYTALVARLEKEPGELVDPALYQRIEDQFISSGTQKFFSVFDLSVFGFMCAAGLILALYFIKIPPSLFSGIKVDITSMYNEIAALVQAAVEPNATVLFFGFISVLAIAGIMLFDVIIKKRTLPMHILA